MKTDKPSSTAAEDVCRRMLAIPLATMYGSDSLLQQLARQEFECDHSRPNPEGK